jgi:hypothetical protein
LKGLEFRFKINRDTYPETDGTQVAPRVASLAHLFACVSLFVFKKRVSQEGTFEDDDEVKQLPKRRTEPSSSSSSSSKSAAQRRKRNREARKRTPTKIPPAFLGELVDGKRPRVMLEPDLAGFFGAPQKATFGSAKSVQQGTSGRSTTSGVLTV